MGYAHGTRWTPELIKRKVMEVVEGLQLDRMPSKSECVKYFGNYRLADAITKKYGWFALAKEMGLPIKKSETSFGKTFEAKASEYLKSCGFEVRRMSQNFPYDLLLNDCVKVDVKASKLYRGEQGNFYSFNLEKPFATCDFYLLLAVDDDNTINRKMIVPSNQVISNNQISVGEHRSKYHQYTDRLDLLETASEFWTGLTGGVTHEEKIS